MHGTPVWLGWPADLPDMLWQHMCQPHVVPVGRHIGGVGHLLQRIARAAHAGRTGGGDLSCAVINKMMLQGERSTHGPDEEEAMPVAP